MDLTIALPETPARLSVVRIGEGMIERVLEDIERDGSGLSSTYWIWDERVWEIWGGKLCERFGWPGPGDGRVILFAASEPNKRLAAVEELARALVQRGADRQCALVAVGGGVTGDVVGVVASLYMRGIPFYQMPTTLLAQVDSSVGGKTGVDLPEGKNLVGAFHQPRIVWIDSCFLGSLPDLEFRQGMAEVIKTAMLGDESLWRFLGEQGDALRRREGAVLTRMIEASCRVKASVVEEDEKEAGRRRVLNLGHTVGHALEKLSGYALRHGDAVAMGMMVAATLSVRLGELPEAELRQLESLCRFWDLPVSVPGEYASDAILEAMMSDKKKMRDKLYFILPVRPGEVKDLVNPDPRLLGDAISALRL